MKNPFDFLKGLGNWQETIKQHQEALEKLEATGEAGATGIGRVTATLNGRFQVKALTIDDEAWQEGKAFTLDLIKSAFNDAVNKIFEKNQGKMTEMFGNMAGAGGSGV